MQTQAEGASQRTYYTIRTERKDGQEGVRAFWFFPSSGRSEASGYWRRSKQALIATMRIMHGAVPWTGGDA